MANNRAYLVCIECLQDPEVIDLWGDNGCLIMMFKYYPNTGWYINVGNELKEKAAWVDKTNEFLDKHKHPSMYGEHLLIFEGELNSPKEIAKREILDKFQKIMSGDYGK